MIPAETVASSCQLALLRKRAYGGSALAAFRLVSGIGVMHMPEGTRRAGERLINPNSSCPNEVLITLTDSLKTRLKGGVSASRDNKYDRLVRRQELSLSN